MSGCSNCGEKGGCDDRKGGMFAAIDEAIALLYPDKVWGNIAPDATMEGPHLEFDLDGWAKALSKRLKTACFVRPAELDAWCDTVDVMCVGRLPCLWQVREGMVAREEALVGHGGGGRLSELYLRVVFSRLAPMAVVQEVAMSMDTTAQDASEVLLEIREDPRTGVFSPTLLKRMRGVVAAIQEAGFRHLDFGDLTQWPKEFDPGAFPSMFGAQPNMANLLFFAGPADARNTLYLTR